MTDKNNITLKPLKIIFFFFACTFIGTICLWILDLAGIFKNVLLSGFTQAQYFGFQAADVFSMTLLLACIVGLKKMKLSSSR